MWSGLKLIKDMCGEKKIIANVIKVEHRADCISCCNSNGTS